MLVAVLRVKLNQRPHPAPWRQRSRVQPLVFSRRNNSSAHAASSAVPGSGRFRCASPPNENSVSGRSPQYGQGINNIAGSYQPVRRCSSHDTTRQNVRRHHPMKFQASPLSRQQGPMRRHGYPAPLQGCMGTFRVIAFLPIARSNAATYVARSTGRPEPMLKIR